MGTTFTKTLPLQGLQIANYISFSSIIKYWLTDKINITASTQEGYHLKQVV